MIELVTGSIFESGCEALVNAVNCKGVMGAGLALEFKNRFPRMMTEYKRACEKGILRPGQVHAVKVSEENPKWVVNFATKDDWKNPSKLEWIEFGLSDLRRWIQASGPKSV